MKFKSEKIYQDLKIFLRDDSFFLRKILLFGIFSKEEFEIIKKHMQNTFNFSDDFFKCIKAGKKIFTADKLLTQLNNLFINLKNEEKECIIISAKKLTQEEQRKIEEKIKKFNKNEEINFHYEIDLKIVGGLIFKIDGKYYDASFQNMLLNIAKKIKKDIKVGSI